MKYIKQISAVLLSLMMLIPLSLFFGAGINTYQDKLSRKYTLYTSHDQTRHARIFIVNNTVYAEGFYKDYNITDFYINASVKNIKQSFKLEADGSFKASFSATCTDSYGYAVLEFEHGDKLTYRIEYNDGWFFGDNGLADEYSERIENPLFADAETSAYYVNEELDETKTRQTLGEIRTLALEITKDLNDDYSKARALNYWVADNIYYDLDTYDSGVTLKTIALSNVLRTRRTVCGGYANLYSALLEAVGIKSVNIRGGVVGDGCTYEELMTKTLVHEWVAFWYEDEKRWVFADPGWDSFNKFEQGQFIGTPHFFKYFDISGLAFSLNHRADKAEQREYFSANEFLQNYSEPTQNIETTSEEKPAENQPLITTSAITEITAADISDTDISEEPPDNTLLVTIIVIMSIGIVIIILVIIINKFKRTEINMEKTVKNAIIEMENGKQIKIELYPETAPITVANFEKLASDGFYNGLTFHRVISGFMIQGGCPDGNGMGGAGENIKGEFKANGVENNLIHKRGVISMARSQNPNSASSQFFIMHKDSPHLDGQYAGFGMVTEGMDAVDEIAESETDYSDKPKTPVVMKNVYMVNN